MVVDAVEVPLPSCWIDSRSACCDDIGIGGCAAARAAIDGAGWVEVEDALVPP